MNENEKTEYEEDEQPLGKTAKEMQERVIFAPEDLPGKLTKEGVKYFWEKYGLLDLVMEAYDLGYRDATKCADIDRTEELMARAWLEALAEEMKRKGLYTGEKEKRKVL